MTISSGAVLYVADLARMSEFYEAVTGWQVGESDDDFAALESPSHQLVLLATPAADAALTTAPPITREDVSVKLVFVVPSIDRVRAAATDLGGHVNGSDWEWTFQSWLVCDGVDPEGNVFQLRELSATRG